MSSVKTYVKISQPSSSRMTFLASASGETGASYYAYKDSLGCTHLVSEEWGSWYRVSPEEVMAEAGRCAGVYAHSIERQKEAKSPLCTYDYMYDRLHTYRRLYEAISKAFPVG
jgi:hypothetical protein